MNKKLTILMVLLLSLATICLGQYDPDWKPPIQVQEKNQNFVIGYHNIEPFVKTIELERIIPLRSSLGDSIKPYQHPFIKVKEKGFIVTTTGQKKDCYLTQSGMYWVFIEDVESENFFSFLKNLNPEVKKYGLIGLGVIIFLFVIIYIYKERKNKKKMHVSVAQPTTTTETEEPTEPKAKRVKKKKINWCKYTIILLIIGLAVLAFINKNLGEIIFYLIKITTFGNVPVLGIIILILIGLLIGSYRSTLKQGERAGAKKDDPKIIIAKDEGKKFSLYYFLSIYFGFIILFYSANLLIDVYIANEQIKQIIINVMRIMDPDNFPAVFFSYLIAKNIGINTSISVFDAEIYRMDEAAQTGGSGRFSMFD
ncbi:hypothetical protein L6278_03120 [Candidatus Parcubacteria bacterium]|nr:hypothetical protein [Patescibacteria group bacterium]MCG2687094.1 hypothetical protein [Candidatus Parcubacteria bacterium]